MVIHFLLFLFLSFWSITGSSQPNIIVIVVDDMRWDEYGAAGHPYLETPNIDRLAQEGALLGSAFHAVPLCSPNRASILTGQYPSRHGITDNVSRNMASHHLVTFPQALQVAGYETAFIGKWHMGNDPTPRPGFDYWVAIPGQGRSIDPELYENGALHTVAGYTTDILTDRAIAFIEKERSQAFFMYIGHKAVHPDLTQRDDGSVDRSKPAPFVPAPRHKGRYAKAVWPESELGLAVQDNLEGKPALGRALQRKTSPENIEKYGLASYGTDVQQGMRERAEMLLAVDDGLGRVIASLEKNNILDETFLLFTSDNGYWYGEHSLDVERRMPYEAGIRMPVLIRYPALIKGGSEINNLVSSVDIAPTILDLAGAETGSHIQGRSTLPLFKGGVEEWRDAVLIEFYTYENPMHWLVDMDYKAIRTDRYKYIHWMQHADENELYDLQTDPYEMQNRFGEEEYVNVEERMRALLKREALHALGL